MKYMIEATKNALQQTGVNYNEEIHIFKNNSDLQDYLALFRDSGWEHISGSKNSGTQYFKKSKIVMSPIFSQIFLQKWLDIKDCPICG
jgi:hypothetical protein